MTTPTIAIIGLGLTGTSFGLGLQREPGDFEIVGHDKDPEATAAAKKAGAIQKGEWNLHRAYEEADLAVLAVPLSELEGLLELMKDGLRPNTLVMTMASIMQPAIEIADRLLPENVHFVVGHPIISGVGGRLTPRDDLFQDTLFCLAPSMNADPDAVQLASDFAERLGAKPFYVDAGEHDGIMAGIEQLPQLMAASLMRMTVAAPGWGETRRLAGRRFAQATEMGSSAEQVYAGLASNRANLLFRIDQLQRELSEWKALLEQETDDDTPPPLLSELQRVVAERERWETQAELKNWEETPGMDELDDQPGFMRQMLLGGMFSRKPKDE